MSGGGENSEGVDEYGNPIEGGMSTNAMVGGGMMGVSGMDMGLMGAEVGADALTGNMGNKTKPKPKPKPKPLRTKDIFDVNESIGNHNKIKLKKY